jgi:hypothetical protein
LAISILSQLNSNRSASDKHRHSAENQRSGEGVFFQLGISELFFLGLRKAPHWLFSACSEARKLLSTCKLTREGDHPAAYPWTKNVGYVVAVQVE